MAKPAVDSLRLDLRLRRHPCPELFDYLQAVPGTQRADTVRYLAYLGWLVQRGAVALPGITVQTPAELIGERPPAAKANPDPLELDLLKALEE